MSGPYFDDEYYNFLGANYAGVEMPFGVFV
jgi:hypothetical protein